MEGTRIGNYRVVRLVGPRRIEVYEKGKPMRTCGPGDELEHADIVREDPCSQGMPALREIL